MAKMKLVTVGDNALNFADLTTGFTVCKGETKEVGKEIYGSKRFQSAERSGHIKVLDKVSDEDTSGDESDDSPKEVTGKPAKPGKPGKDKKDKTKPTVDPEVQKIESLETDDQMVEYLEENYEVNEEDIQTFLALEGDDKKKDYLKSLL